LRSTFALLLLLPLLLLLLPAVLTPPKWTHL
jgi:hypothetical protein